MVPIITTGLSTVKDTFRTYTDRQTHTHTHTHTHILKSIYLYRYKAGNIN